MRLAWMLMLAFQTNAPTKVRFKSLKTRYERSGTKASQQRARRAPLELLVTRNGPVYQQSDREQP